VLIIEPLSDSFMDRLPTDLSIIKLGETKAMNCALIEADLKDSIIMDYWRKRMKFERTPVKAISTFVMPKYTI